MSAIRLCISVLALTSTLTAHAEIMLSAANPDENIPAIAGADEEASASETLFEETNEKSYWIPALEIVGFDLLLNQFNRRFIDDTDYDTSFSTVKDNLESSWRTDNNRFEINQLGHPYQGSMYHGFARSAGLNFWESFAYTIGGSAFWEIAGEATPPSRNDMITTSLGGPLLGESLFRMASLLLEQGGNNPGFWRELGASAISPPTGFNRYAFEDRFDRIFSSNEANYYSRLQLGVSSAVESNRAASDDKKTDGQIDFTLGYGLPGQPGYSYTRPFDHFIFQATASTNNVIENVSTRGLLLGKDYELGRNYRGIWGLYGTYDYIYPQTYRISSTALALGTTGQLWLSRNVALQGSVLGGIGYSAIGSASSNDEKDYHFETTPQGLLSLRMIYGNKASLDYTHRQYSINDHESSLDIDDDKIMRTDLALTFKVKDSHGISVRYQWNERDVDHAGPGDLSRSIETIGIYYTFLGKEGFGATEWR